MLASLSSFLPSSEGSHYVFQAVLEFLGSRDAPASASLVAGSTGTPPHPARCWYFKLVTLGLIICLLEVVSFHFGGSSFLTQLMKTDSC